MKGKIPGVLWVLPILFGIIGGIVAGLIASLKYEASWWELLLAGFLCSIFYLFLSIILFVVILSLGG